MGEEDLSPGAHEVVLTLGNKAPIRANITTYSDGVTQLAGDFESNGALIQTRL